MSRFAVTVEEFDVDSPKVATIHVANTDFNHLFLAVYDGALAASSERTARTASGRPTSDARETEGGDPEIAPSVPGTFDFAAFGRQVVDLLGGSE